MVAALPHVPGFRILSQAGRGGMGRVYVAKCVAHGRIALKVLDGALDDGTFRRRFAHEIELAGRVRSRCVAAILDADPDADEPWIAMELVDGPTLQERVNRDGRLPPKEVLNIVRDAAQALADIHAAGIVHRDLKPSNILLGSDGQARVTDFGIAAITGMTQLTATGQRIGTLHYTSPEQLRGEPATGASDIFALGAVAHFAATGRSLFGGGSEGEVVGRILAGRYPRTEVGDPRVQGVITACLRAEPGRRALPAGVVEHCKRALALAPRGVDDPGEQTVTRRRGDASGADKPRRPWLIAAVAAGGLGALAAGSAAAWQLTRPGPPPPTVTAAAQTYPQGDRVRIDWTVTAGDEPVEATLTVDGTAPPRPCPERVTTSGACTFTGKHDTAYRIAIDASSNGGMIDPVTVTTFPAPAVSVRSGEKVADAGGLTGCPVLVDAAGLAPNRPYEVRLMTDVWDRQGRSPQQITLALPTDARGSVTGAGVHEVQEGQATEIAYGEAAGWVRVQLADLVAVKNPWGCP